MQKILVLNQHKTSDGEFIFELLIEYELSPKESESIVETAKRCFIRNLVLNEGEIEVSVIEQNGILSQEDLNFRFLFLRSILSTANPNSPLYWLRENQLRTKSNLFRRLHK